MPTRVFQWRRRGDGANAKDFTFFTYSFVCGVNRESRSKKGDAFDLAGKKRCNVG